MDRKRRRTNQSSFRFVDGAPPEARTCKRIISETPVSSSETCLRGIQIRKVLGRGDVGVAYDVDPKSIKLPDIQPRGSYVLKEVLLQNAKDLEDFRRETKIGTALGKMNIAPAIHKCWICTQSPDGNPISFPAKGFYVMDRIDRIWDKTFPGKGPGKRLAPKTYEKRLVGVLTKMVSEGYLHQDCHPGNIGILKNGKVVVFDFGFSVKHPTPMTAPETLLLAQIYIVIEQYDKDIMFDSYLYDVVYDIRQGKFKM